MKLLARACLAAAVLCAAAPHAFAQTTQGPDPWSLGVGVSGSYEGNALFVGPEADEEFSHSVTSTLGRAWTLRRGSAQLSAGGSQFFYRKSASLNDFRYNITGNLTHALTRRLNWSGTSTLTSGLARDSDVLTDAGLVLPSVETRSSSSSSNFSYAMSRRSNLSWSLSQLGVGFASGLFQGGSSLSSVVNWTHEVGRSQSVGVTQDYARTFADDTQASIYGFLGTWSGTAGAWTTHASMGVRPFTIPEETGYRFALAISAGVAKPLGPGKSVGINYDRSITPTFGVDSGNHLLQSVSGNYAMALSRNLSTSFGGSYSRGTNPVAPERKLTGATGTASLSYRVTSRLGAMFGASLYSRTFPDTGRVSSYNMMTGLTYGFSWR